MSVILVNKQRVTNFRTLCPLVFLPNLLSLFSLMYGGQLLTHLKGKSIMLLSLMILLNSLGFYLLRFKSDIFQKFTEFQTMVEHLFSTKLLARQTDGGGEYQKMNSFLAQKGIIHYLSCPHAHQQNGSTERKYRHIVIVALALLAQASVPLKFWDKSITTATYLINRTPSKVLNFATSLE
jgi:hypothetical protein